MRLEFNVAEQTLSMVSKQNVVADSLNYLHCQFTFTDEWRGLNKTAVFISNTDAVYNVILENDCCEVPWEVIQAPSFRVSVFGGNRITTTLLTVNVSESGYMKGESPGEPTPDVYEQILNSIKPSYAYKTVDMASVVVMLDTNTVTYVYGEEAVDGNIGFAFDANGGITDAISEEIVLILDLSLLAENPSIMFPSIVKWFGGEPPTIEAGKVYMFSFVRANIPDDSSVYFFLGIGGEFA